MKKLFLIPILACLMCVNALADNVVKVTSDANPDGTEYTTFDAATQAIKNAKVAGQTITLLADATMSSSVSSYNAANYISVIDLGGYKLTTSSTAYYAVSGTELTIKNGTIKLGGTSKYFASVNGLTQKLNLEDVEVDASSTKNTLADKSQVITLVSMSKGALTIDEDCEGINVISGSDFANITITNEGGGTTYFNNVAVKNSDLADRIGEEITGGVALIPDYVYNSVYSDYQSLISQTVQDKMFISLVLDANSDLVPMRKLNGDNKELSSSITIDNVEYFFTGLTSYGTEANPAKLKRDYSSGQWISGGYIDLNGYTWTIGTSGKNPAIKPTGNRTLTIVNSKSTGCIQIDGAYSATQYAIQLQTTNASEANYQVLTIGEGVTINMPNVQGYALAVFAKSGDKGYGTVFNLNGTINVPNGSGISINGTLQNSADKTNSPIFNISGTINSKIAGIYVAGYGVWNISEGANITGEAFAVGIKSGVLNITGGTLTCNGNAAGRVETYGNGMNSSCAALQIESNEGYAGDMEIAISGGTLISDSWYAIYEYGSSNTAVNSIAVTGGNFQGGILTSQSLAAKGGFVSGGKWTVDVTANVTTGKAANPIDEAPYIVAVGDPTAETAEITTEENKNAVLTNSDGESYAGSYSSETVGDDADVKTTTATNQVVISENTDVVVDTTHISNSTIVEVKKVTVEGDAELTIKEGATLMVGTGSVLLDENTSTGGLTVEAGAALVVEGLVYGSTEDNFVIEGEEDKSGIVLFSPETEFVAEDHPTATYRFTSKSFRDGSKWVYQRFGMPSYDGNVTVKSGNMGINSYICTWDYDIDDWSAWLKIESAAGLVYTDAVPFQCYQLGSTNAKDAPVTYDFVVDLMGNANAPLNFKTGWNPYANSYTAPIDIKSFLTDVLADFPDGNISATIYLYKDLGNDTYTWQGINLGNVGMTYRVRENGAMVKKTYDSSIEPMQAFIMKLAQGDEANAVIDYKDNIYNPAMGVENSAPSRLNNNLTEMQIGVYNDNYWDNISIIESDNFSAAFDNGYDAEKYGRNNGICLYVLQGDTRLERIATDNVGGLFIGIDAPQAGTYTLDFSDINGLEYALVDMSNNTSLAITEGMQYNFYAEAGANDYRFHLVKVAQMPTDANNAELVSIKKGIYTLTGIYMGEDMNRLPAGVYIVNGEKFVK